MMPALSTTRPVSCGCWASAGSAAPIAMTISRARRMPARLMTRIARPARNPLLRAEVDLRHLHLVLRHGEVLERHRIGEPELGPDDRREGTQRRVVDAHRLDVVAAGDRDAVFGPLELRLQGKEVLVRLEVG